jgi:hypothetical protein
MLLKPLLTILLSSFLGHNPLVQKPISSHPSYESNALAPLVCPIENDKNRSIMENFLTKSSWSTERVETFTSHLSVSQITVLNDLNHASACSSFNHIYEEALTEDNGLGEPANNVTYYKVDNFYFVVISLRKSDDPEVITMGLSFIDIYSGYQKENLVEAYAF